MILFSGSSTTDLRRKIEIGDYTNIKFEVNVVGMTIREVATERGISTKYVGKILDRLVGHAEPIWEAPLQNRFQCSGCARMFSMSGIAEHYSIWTSGGNPLMCVHTLPGSMS
mgnify:CR=1 FL=1